MAPENAAENIEDGAQEALFEFEGYPVEKQFVRFTGVVEFDGEITHGDEVVIEIHGVVQDANMKTRARGGKDTTAKITTCGRGVKVDTATLKRSVPRLIKS